ncbi:hypothetical protein HY358_02305 [Candidatus Roizmanbacteria bacterium]|nr:hypothetical protein [Candidatus Roizmanbacteria bacterium]
MIKKITLAIGILILILVSAAFLSMKAAQSKPPPEIVANFTNLDKIEKISRYRSCTGHVTVPQDEREGKRNMKHYFWVKPEYNKSKTVEIYSPYEGYVADIRSDPQDNLEGEIWISSEKIFALMPPFGVWSFSVQHIDVRGDLKLGDKVKAGELIGWAALSEKRGNSFDIIYGKSGFPPKRIDNWTAPFADLDSVFNHMNDEVFAQYQKKGISSKQDILISKEKRDQNPCQYKEKGPYFMNRDDQDNWVYLQ